MNLTIISGGQTGADQAGWRAAKRFGLVTGGWMTKGFKTEDGPRPEFAEMYGAKENDSPDYPPRTVKNVKSSDVTLWFSWPKCDSPGYYATLKGVKEKAKETGLEVKDLFYEPFVVGGNAIVEMIVRREIKIINIAGNRESSSPGVGRRTELWLCKLFTELGLMEASK